jgi:predicted nucleic acid-binding protein
VIVSNTTPALMGELIVRLDSGEAAAICLALQIGAAAVLIDEVEGRRVAQRHGLKVIGTLALLVEMNNRGLLDDLAHTLHLLRHELHFWFSDELRDWALSKIRK